MADDGYNTYLRPVQILTEIIPDFMELTNEVGFTWFRYQALGRHLSVPFNSMIADGAETTEAYNEKILAYLRRLLDEGYVFATPFNGHFVAYIGYNADGFLALGSYGQHADKGGLHPIRETTFLADAIRSCIFIKVPHYYMQSVAGARAPSRLHGMSQDLKSIIFIGIVKHPIMSSSFLPVSPRTLFDGHALAYFLFLIYRDSLSAPCPLCCIHYVRSRCNWSTTDTRLVF